MDQDWVAPVKLPLGRLALAARQHGPHIFQAQAEMIQQRGIHVHAHARQRAAAHAHLSDAPNLRKLLHDDGGRDVVDLARAAARASVKRQNDDRLLGGVDLPPGRSGGKIGRQLAARRVDGRLDVARGRVDVAVQIELQRDAQWSPARWSSSFR